jgi:hypothetical protein
LLLRKLVPKAIDDYAFDAGMLAPAYLLASTGSPRPVLLPDKHIETQSNIRRYTTLVIETYDFVSGAIDQMYYFALLVKKRRD